ncbi:N-acetyltransferase family protein [Labilibaculum sp.]|uniref:GNAT family N-acetyltransferase n=1 Tax=Labilibaculum sp. TaxID=2060723 RepID=UPI0035632E51
MDLSIQPMTKESWADVARIYEMGIATKNATFQNEIPDWDSWNKAHSKHCRLVGLVNGKIVVWAALSPISSRPVYAGVAELSVYVDSAYRGKGLGHKMMDAIIKESEEKGIWTLQSGVFPENTGSINLHHKHGFSTIGIKKRIGKMEGKWRDVALLERRSTVVGID